MYIKIKSVQEKFNQCMLYGKNNFAIVLKNIARFENDFVELSK